MEQIKRLNPYLRKRFNKKIYKVALNPGTTCPNRDGTIGTGGCIFCSSGGSGDFAASSLCSITSQLEEGIEKISSKLPPDAGYIAYFQAFTGTYGEASRLKMMYMEAAMHPGVEIVSVATRPDCLPPEIIEVLKEVARVKPVMVELGFQTSNEQTAEYIRRGYRNEVFEKAVNTLRQAGIEVVVHIILGLPGENIEDMINTIEYVNGFDVQGIKLQLLHVLEHTDLAEEYYRGNVKILTMEEYGEILCACVEHIREDIVIHRLTGDGPKKILIEPKWSGDKKKVLNYINGLFRERNIVQGRRCENYGNGFVHII